MGRQKTRCGAHHVVQTQVARRVASIHVESTTMQEQASPGPEPEEETNYLSPLSENRCVYLFPLF